MHPSGPSVDTEAGLSGQGWATTTVGTMVTLQKSIMPGKSPKLNGHFEFGKLSNQNELNGKCPASGVGPDAKNKPRYFGIEVMLRILWVAQTGPHATT